MHGREGVLRRWFGMAMLLSLGLPLPLAAWPCSRTGCYPYPPYYSDSFGYYSTHWRSFPVGAPGCLAPIDGGIAQKLAPPAQTLPAKPLAGTLPPAVNWKTPVLPVSNNAPAEPTRLGHH